MNRGWLILMAGVLAGASALAQADGGKERIDWTACLELTRAGNPDLVAARAAVRAAEYQVFSANAVFLPQLLASAGLSRGESERNGDWWDMKSANGRLSLSQDLFSGGGNVAARRRAVAQLRVTEEQFRKTLADVELRTRLAFVEVLYARDLVELTQRIAARRGNNVRLIQMRFDGGRENAGSLARSQAQLAFSEYEVRQAQRALAHAQRNLAAAMGRSEVPAEVVGALEVDAPEALADLEWRMRQTPDYRIAATQVEAAKAGWTVARSALFPKISFDVSAGLSSSDYEEYDASWSAGLNASIPLYTGGRNRSGVGAAREQMVQSEMGLLNLENTLQASLLQNWNALLDAVEGATVQRQLHEAETLRAEIAAARYRQGLLDYENWDVIENNLISQGKSHLQARRAAAVRQAQWKNALGESVWYEEGRIR